MATNELMFVECVFFLQLLCFISFSQRCLSVDLSNRQLVSTFTMHPVGMQLHTLELEDVMEMVLLLLLSKESHKNSKRLPRPLREASPNPNMFKRGGGQRPFEQC